MIVVRVCLDSTRSLLFGGLSAKEAGLFLGYLGQGILVYGAGGRFTPAVPTFPDRSLAQDLRGIVEILTVGDPRLEPFQKWVDEHSARIDEIRRKQQPNQLQMLLGQLKPLAQESVE